MGSLILNTRVLGEPATARQSADWLSRLMGAMHGATDACMTTRTQSESVWEGPAGAALRSDLTDTADGANTLLGHTDEFRQGLLTFADRLDAVRAKMYDAHSKAVAAGLKVTVMEIYPPAPIPSGPPLGNGSSLQSPADAQRMAAEHDVAMDQYHAAIDDWNRQAPVYNDCCNIVLEARELEKTAHEDLDKLATGIDGWVKNLKKISTMALSTSLDAIKGSQEAINDLTRLSVELSDSAEVFNKIANGKYLTDADKTVLSAWEADSQAKAGTMAARADSIGHWMNKIPEQAKQFIVLNPDSLVGATLRNRA